MEDRADELYRGIRRNFSTRKVVTSNIDKTWSANFFNMKVVTLAIYSGYKSLLTVIHIFSKYGLAVLIKDKTYKSFVKSVSLIMTQNLSCIITKRKPKDLWVDKGTEFYNDDYLGFLKDVDSHIYPIHNESKAVVIERFNHKLKNIMWKYFIALKTYKCVDVLQDLLLEFNNSKHRTIGMKPADVRKVDADEIREILQKPSVKFKSAKSKVGDHFRVSKNNCPWLHKGYIPNWSEEIFIIKKYQNSQKSQRLTY